MWTTALLTALAFDPQPDAFRPGDLQLRAGAGIEFNGIGGGSVLSIAEGWHPVSAALDVGIVRIGSVTLGMGVEVGAATQLLVNPFMRTRVALGEHLPDWLGFKPGEEGNWRWRPTTLMGGGRVHAHLTSLEGRPYVVVVGERHRYRNRIRHRTDEREFLYASDIWGISAGAGSTSVLPSGLMANIEVRYGFPLWNSQAKEIEIGGSTVPVLRRMRPPPGVIFIGSIGFRL